MCEISHNNEKKENPPNVGNFFGNNDALHILYEGMLNLFWYPNVVKIGLPEINANIFTIQVTVG